MILKQGPFESLQFADGFVAGIEHLASYLGDFDGPLPTVHGEPYPGNDGNSWFVDLELSHTTIQFTNIAWDTDGDDVELPTSVTASVDDDFDPDEQGADLLSDNYGFCVFSFNWHWLPSKDKNQ